VDKASSEMVTGEYEQMIRMQSIHAVLSKIDKAKLLKSGNVKVLMDKKLRERFRKIIEDELKRHLGIKKRISVDTTGSARERGIQLADLIAGAFRARLMKRSGLFEVDYTHVFQIMASDIDNFKTENI
jgi:hypothetical protein